MRQPKTAQPKAKFLAKKPCWWCKDTSAKKRVRYVGGDPHIVCDQEENKCLSRPKVG